jgi:hypothetical protein
VAAVPRRDLLKAAGASLLLPGAASAYGVPQRPERTPSGPLSVSLSDLLEEEVTTSQGAASEDATKKADAMRKQEADLAAMKEARAAVAIKRMDENAEAIQRSQQRAAASGLPPCPSEGPWGSNTGLLSAKACARTRDGFIDQRKPTGFGVIF